MKIKNIILCLISGICVSFTTESLTKAQFPTLLAQKINEDHDITSSSDATIYFQYENEDITNIINMLAAEKKVNIILPTGSNSLEANKIKVTLFIKNPLTLDEAWSILYTLLDVTGYTMVPKNDMYVIMKNSKLIAKEPIPLYVATPIDRIPNTDQPIRYLYYLTNKIADDPSKDTIVTTLKDILPETASINVDTATNALIITDKANDIRSALAILDALNQKKYNEIIDTIKLEYTSAEAIAKLFTENILKTSNDLNKYNLKTRSQKEDAFFSSQIKIIADPRTNKLFIRSKEQQTIDQIKDFIFKYIDVPLDTGKSILHIYPLQYLNAAKFATTLGKIVESESSGTSQARGESQTKGIDRFFENVLITPAIQLGEEAAGQFSGNKLIIAAKNEDWFYIKKIIEELDTPQPQVIIEVLVADLLVEDTKQLGSIIRNPQNLDFKGNVDIQAAQGTAMVFDKPPTTLASDLLAQTGGPENDLSAVQFTALGEMGEPGSTAVSFSDNQTGSTWGILQVLEKFSYSKILSHPHIIALNNTDAKIRIGEQRLLPGEATATSGGQVINFQKVNADLTVTITPRISSDNTVNLQITININEFGPSNSIIKRTVTTNATVGSNDILSLGGLIRTDLTNSLNETPVLSQIPILGWFFKKRRKAADRTNLTIFVSPTIVSPRLRGGISTYTKDYINLASSYSVEADLFDGLRDPITHFFFKNNINVKDEVDEFLSREAPNTRPLFANRSTQNQPTATTVIAKNESTSSIPTVPPVASSTHAGMATTEPSHALDVSTMSIAAHKPAGTITTSSDNTQAPSMTVTTRRTMPEIHEKPARNSRIPQSVHNHIEQPIMAIASKEKAEIPTRENQLRNLLKNESNPLVNI
ncbi:MAG TPA: hypothetical protein VGT41_04440 [Candidatus Babeliales bacterium]|nr:hypothetical protein [Candidatus Babeliales bacterium]